MKIFHKIDRYFWAALISGIAAGFLAPNFFSQFESYVIWVVMTILFTVSLKIDIADALHHIRKPLVILYILAVAMLVAPTVIYVLFNGQVDTGTLTGLVLLAALPCGVSSAVFTDIMDGHTSLSLLIVLVSTLLAPFTIPLIFLGLFNTNMALDYHGLFISLLKIILLPIGASQIVKSLLKNHIERVEKNVNGIVITLLSFMIATIMGAQQGNLMSHADEILPLLGLIYALFVILQLIGYFGVFWMKKGAKVAVANSNVIMNNILGVVLAMAFFDDPMVTLVIVLSIIPWSTIVIFFHWYKKYLP